MNRLSELEPQILRNLGNLQSQLQCVNLMPGRDPPEGTISFFSTCLVLYSLPAGVCFSWFWEQIVTCENGEILGSKFYFYLEILLSLPVHAQSSWHRSGRCTILLSGVFALLIVSTAIHFFFPCLLFKKVSLFFKEKFAYFFDEQVILHWDFFFLQKTCGSARELNKC